MSATLVCRPGDVQALKAVAAATATNTPVEIIPLSDGKWKKLVSDDTAAPLSLREIFLILAAGSTLTEPNAIARYLGTFYHISLRDYPLTSQPLEGYTHGGHI